MGKIVTVDETFNLTGGDFNLDESFVLDGMAVDIGTGVIKWDDPGGFDGYTRKRVVRKVEDRRTGKAKTKTISGPRFSQRKGGVPSIRQFFVHHSGGDGRNPSGMYETLYNTRKLSVHFAVEDDGRIYQFNDAADCCWHAGGHNQMSIGVECCLMPDRAKRPDYYSAARRKRTGNLLHKPGVDWIHGRRHQVFAFTVPQVAALARLAAGCWLATQRRTILGGHVPYPGMERMEPPRFPRTQRDEIFKTVYPAHLEHVGLIGHLQCTKRKWDPAGFPWEQFETLVAGHYEEFYARALRG